MRNITTLALCTLVLSGCATAVNTPYASTRLILNMRVPTSMGVLYAMKNSPGFEKCYPKVNTDYGYSILGGHCAFKPKDTPDKIVIEYARWLKSGEGTRRYKGTSGYDAKSNEFIYRNLQGVKLSREQWLKEGWQREVNAISQLPPSAWRTYTIYPKQILKEYQGVTPQGGSATTSGFRKVVDYHLIVQPDSTIKTSAAYMYESSGEGWRN